MIQITNNAFALLSVAASEATENVFFRTTTTDTLKASRFTILKDIIFGGEMAASISYKIPGPTKKTS